MAVIATASKRLLISKANARIVAYVSVAVFILIFSLVATKTFVSQAAYQNRVISKKQAALNQLKADIAATGRLRASYRKFVGASTNVLGGNSSGSGPQDGSNAQIVLDALPSSYNFPGLTTSLESLLTSQNVSIQGIGGTDEEVTQSTNTSSVNPEPVQMPFTATVQGNYASIQNVISAFGHSIRPMQILQMGITGTKDNLILSIKAQTYYQPAKSLNIKKEVVK